MVRAKFVCSMKNDNVIAFNPVYSGSKENEQFFRATPGGQIMLNVVNEDAAKQFEPGKEYYVDFTPADKPQQVKTTETQTTSPATVVSQAQSTEPQTTKQPVLKTASPQDVK